MKLFDKLAKTAAKTAPAAAPVKPLIDVKYYASRFWDGATEEFPILRTIARKLNTKKGRVGIGIALGGIAAAMLYMVYEANMHVRMYNDLQRVSDLEELTLVIQEMYGESAILPASLKDVERRPSPAYVRDHYLYDPESNHSYEYKALDDRSYQICGTFTFSTAEVAHEIPSDAVNPAWNHQTGHHCFIVDVESGVTKSDDASGNEPGKTGTSPDASGSNLIVPALVMPGIKPSGPHAPYSILPQGPKDKNDESPPDASSGVPVDPTAPSPGQDMTDPANQGR